MKSKALLALGLALALMLSGCAAQNDAAQIDYSASQSIVSATDIEPTTYSVQTPSQTTAPEQDTMFTNRDISADYDESESAHIKLDGDTASCDSDAVKINGGTVTITDEGTYILTGTLSDGMIIVNADDADKLQLVLDGASINSEACAPILILKADKVVITLPEGSENTLSNGGTFTPIDDNNIDGVIFSKADLTLNGSGSLSVVSPAGHGIVCKDDLAITGGNYSISSASHGIDANDSVRTTSAQITIVSGKDGIHSENTDDASQGFVYVADGSFNIEAEGDGISAEAYMQIEDGSFNIVSGGGSVNAKKQTSDAWGGFGGHGGGIGGGMGGGVSSGTDDGSGSVMGGGPGNGQPSGGMGGQPGGEMGGQPGGGMGGGFEGGKRPDMQAPQTPTDARPSQAPEIPMTPPETIVASETDDTSTSIKGLKATGDIVINGGTFTVDSADDSIHSNASITVNNGSFELKSGDDGFHADETVTIAAGKINISESYEGIEGLHVTISGGDVSLVASDDGLNAAGGTDQSGFGGQRGNDKFGGFGGGMSSSSGGSIVISGGSLYINASGDGLDANGSLEISGGTTIVSCPTSGDTAVLDYDTSGVITGGTFIGTGATQMAQSFSSSEQGVVAAKTGNQSSGANITLTDSAGNAILSHEADQGMAFAILSSPDIAKGETYTLTIGDYSQAITAN